jgi:FKBP-type peptidyl-prolyl cis-trans isomerase FkpA
MRKIVLIVVAFLCVLPAMAQQTKVIPGTGIELKYIKKGTGTVKPKMGDYVAVIMKGMAGSKVLFNTKDISKSAAAPVNFQVKKGTYPADVMNAFPYFVEGDSVHVIVNQDSFFRNAPLQNRPKEIKPGQPVVYYVKVTSVKTKKQYDKEVAEYNKFMADQKKQQAQMLKAQKEAKALVGKQDKQIKDYIATNGLGNFTKLKSGLYYIIDQEGDGDYAYPRTEVTVNYTGMLLDGKKFDSNVDSAFGHVQPFNTKVGVGQVIPGWDEGMQKFKKGSKGKLLIPSALGYGPNGQGANIPPNSVLRFDIEVLDVLDTLAVKKKEDDARKAAEEKRKAAADMRENQIKELEKYCADNNLKYEKQPSGLIVVTEVPGSLPKPKPGDECTMNYTGMRLDGVKFDSNVDSAFNHVSPFKFSINKGMVIRGWDEGVAKFGKGGKGKLLIPSDMAYGEGGSGANIPGNTPLIFDIEVIDIQTPAPPAGAAPTNQPKIIGGDGKTIQVGGNK